MVSILLLFCLVCVIALRLLGLEAIACKVARFATIVTYLGLAT